ncbi:hypothetical protein GCM10010441_47780 [Kitasatospora paracochleata]|uniref:hypothetical protein n=1 Tax=Kitasatospora paracochleata TaxID=58354 RepID=UPI0031DDD34E
MPHDRSDAFTVGGTGLRGEALAGSFDYVVAIDCNREHGSSLLDPAKPDGPMCGAAGSDLGL